MSIKQIIQESINKNPVGLKEALEEELRARVALALEAKMNDVEDEDYEEDEDEELDEATKPSFAGVLKAHEYKGDGRNYTGHGGTKVTHRGDHVVSYNDADGRIVHKTPSHLNKHLNALHDVNVNLRSIKEDEDEELDEATTVVYRNKETGEIWSKDFDDVIAAQRAYQMYKTRDYASNVKIGSPDRMKLVAKGLKNKS